MEQIRETINQETGEIFNLKDVSLTSSKVILSGDQLTKKRFDNLYKVQSLLNHDFRTKRCHKYSTGGNVQLFYSPQYKKSFFSGMVTCGSIWTCPVCSAKIVSKRANYLEQAIKQHYADNKTCLMLTLTAPHKINDLLQDLLSAWRNSSNQLFKNRQFTNTLKSLSYLGVCRSLEITFTPYNGWHVHLHYLVFTELENYPENKLQESKHRILTIWQETCVKNGLNLPNHYSVDLVICNIGSSNYVLKWGPWDEMLKGSMKESKENSSYTPFQLAMSNDPYFHRKFLEYAYATTSNKQSNRKSLAHFKTSPKLNKYFKNFQFDFDLNTSDETLVDEQTAKAKPLFSLTDDQLSLLKETNQLPIFLTVCNQGTDHAKTFLNNLRVN